jgi:hypothetical protein
MKIWTNILPWISTAMVESTMESLRKDGALHVSRKQLGDGAWVVVGVFGKEEDAPAPAPPEEPPQHQ